MSPSFDLVTFDSPSPDDLAAFLASGRGMVETEHEDGGRSIALSTTDGSIANLADPEGNRFDRCAYH